MMKAIIFLFLLLSSSVFSQHTGLAIYQVEKNAELKRALPYLSKVDVDVERTFSEHIYAYDTLYYDTTTQVTHLCNGGWNAKIYDTSGEMFPFSSKVSRFSYYTLLSTDETFSYLRLTSDHRCLHKLGKNKYSISLEYTGKDTVIAGYDCEEAYFVASNSEKIFVYTCNKIPSLCIPSLSKFNNLRGGIVLYLSPKRGSTLLQSITYKDLPKEATQLPDDVEISDEPCSVPY